MSTVSNYAQMVGISEEVLQAEVDALLAETKDFAETTRVVECMELAIPFKQEVASDWRLVGTAPQEGGRTTAIFFRNSPAPEEKLQFVLDRAIQNVMSQIDKTGATSANEAAQAITEALGDAE